MNINENIDNIMEISVRDTGVGIPKSIQEKLFQDYGTFDHFNGTNE